MPDIPGTSGIDLASALAELSGATGFEGAARGVLARAMAVAGRALASSSFAGQGAVLRALVHLRPGYGYRGLVALESDGAEFAPPSRGQLASSATAWRLVQERSAPVFVDVVAQIYDGPEGRLQAEGAGSGESLSRPALLERNVTHLLALPLRAPGGEVAGMIAIEARCRAAVKRSFDAWALALDDLSLLALLASPWLTTLPHEPTREITTDPALPVIGASMHPVVRMLRTFARFDETVLIRGPSGSGKTFLARWCAGQSPRRDRPFTVVNLHEQSDGLREAALFGWTRGAFTGAVSDHDGFVARAEGGTLFIDEIDKLPLQAQGKLLRLLEQKRYTRVGEGRSRAADVRFIVGTNADLEREVAEGRFLLDLYYRVNVLPVTVPALGERRDEIGAWASYFAHSQHARYSTAGTARVTADAQVLLSRASWPGNLRQLHSVVNRAYAFASFGEHGDLPSAVTIGATHVRRAFMLDEGDSALASVLDGLRHAAEVLVAAADRRPGAVSLKQARAFAGLVLDAGIARWGLREAFVRLGEEPLLRGGNHLKRLDAELARVVELYEALGEPLPPDLHERVHQREPSRH